MALSQRRQPKRDACSVTVGVTGHRFLVEIDKIQSGIDAALATIEASFGGRPLIIVSALAEGADRLVVERVLARPGGQLRVVLPLEQADYERDFAKPASLAAFRRLLGRATRVETLQVPGTRLDAYFAGGTYLIDHCDVLLAVWDGRDAHGHGGTGAIVNLAREVGLPIAWVHAGNRLPGTSTPTSLGAKQGTVTYERLSPP